MPLAAAFKIILNIHSSTPSVPSHSVSFIPPPIFPPFLFLPRISLSSITQNCLAAADIQGEKTSVPFAITAHWILRVGFLPRGCRGVQVGAIPHLPAAHQERAQSPGGWATSPHIPVRNRRMVHKLSELFAHEKQHTPEKMMKIIESARLE